MSIRYHLKRHPSGRAIAAIDVPTYLGAMRFTGVGDYFSDAFGIASKIASRVSDDPVLSAIMPPQVSIALKVVNALSKASQQGPDAVKDQMGKMTGPGAQRLAQTLHDDAKAKGDNTAAGVARSALSSGNYYGLPDDKPTVGTLDLDEQEGANYGNEEWQRARDAAERELDASLQPFDGEDEHDDECQCETCTIGPDDAVPYPALEVPPAPSEVHEAAPPTAPPGMVWVPAADGVPGHFERERAMSDVGDAIDDYYAQYADAFADEGPAVPQSYGEPQYAQPQAYYAPYPYSYPPDAYPPDYGDQGDQGDDSEDDTPPPTPRATVKQGTPSKSNSGVTIKGGRVKPGDARGRGKGKSKSGPKSNLLP